MKYKNTSGFRQVIIIEGKKTVVFADDVVDVSHELINAAFERVADNAEVTHKARTIKKPTGSDEKVNFTDLESKIESVKKEASEVAGAQLIELKSTQNSEISAIRAELADFKALVIKRLEILKSVVKTLEYEVGQLYSDEEVDEEQKPFQR